MTERTKEEIMENIDHIIDQYVQPAVASHGGMIKLENFDVETGRVLVMLQGSCSGCSSSTITLKMGVENMLVHYIPEVTAVDGIDDPNYNDPFYP
jgi:Fe-S cluster biogenesis protein NfuA